MKSKAPPPAQGPRELRRRCIVPARLRHGTSWSDTCILNISSHGLMIHTGHSIQAGTKVELRRGDCTVDAKVMWSEGGRAGLRSEECLPIDQIVTSSQSAVFRLGDPLGERRRRARFEDKKNLIERAIEVGGALIIATCLAAAGSSMVRPAFARPIAIVRAALNS